MGALVGALVGTLMGALVDPLKDPLVRPLVGQISLSPALCVVQKCISLLERQLIVMQFALSLRGVRIMWGSTEWDWEWESRVLCMCPARFEKILPP